MDRKLVVTSDVSRRAVPIGSAEAADILETTLVNVNRWAHSGYLPYVGEPASGSGNNPWLFDRNVVEKLSAARAEAFRVLGYKQPSERKQTQRKRTRTEALIDSIGASA